jgi:hypothetical protein
MSIQQVQKYTSRSIRRQRIRCRLQAIEIIFSVLITLELPSQIVIRPVLGVLEIVFPVRRRLSDVDDCAWNSLSSQEIGNFAVHEGRVSAGSGILNYATTERAERGVGGPEGPEDGGGGGVRTFGQQLVGDFVDESADISFWCKFLKSVTTYDSRPRTSEILCPSFRTLVLIWPMELTKWTPIIHSSTESSTSREKSWRCLMRAEETSRLRASVLGPIVSIQCWVKLGSNLDCAIVVDVRCR